MTLEPLMPGDIDNIFKEKDNPSSKIGSPKAPFTGEGASEGESLAESLSKYRTQLREAWKEQNPSVDDDKEEIIRKSRALFINLVPDVAEGVAYLINCAQSESVRLQAMKFAWEVVNGDQGRGGPLDPLQRFLDQLKGLPETPDDTTPLHIIEMAPKELEEGKDGTTT